MQQHANGNATLRRKESSAFKYGLSPLNAGLHAQALILRTNQKHPEESLFSGLLCPVYHEFKQLFTVCSLPLKVQFLLLFIKETY